MNPQCHNCGKIVRLRMGITFEFTVAEAFRRDNPDSPEKIYLCVKCGNNPEILARYKQAFWYASDKII